MEPEPPWWPAGADPEKVRECNCPHCAELIERLEEWLEGRDGDGNATLDGQQWADGGVPADD